MFDIERRDAAAIVHVTEDLDIASKSRLADSIVAAETGGPTRILVSLQRCEYCDSTGLGELVKARRRLGARFHVVASPASQCRKIFELTGLTAILQISPTVEAALALAIPID